jgi:hypothetical protein
LSNQFDRLGIEAEREETLAISRPSAPIAAMAEDDFFASASPSSYGTVSTIDSAYAEPRGSGSYEDSQYFAMPGTMNAAGNYGQPTQAQIDMARLSVNDPTNALLCDKYIRDYTKLKIAVEVANSIGKPVSLVVMRQINDAVTTLASFTNRGDTEIDSTFQKFLGLRQSIRNNNSNPEYTRRTEPPAFVSAAQSNQASLSSLPSPYGYGQSTPTTPAYSTTTPMPTPSTSTFPRLKLRKSASDLRSRIFGKPSDRDPSSPRR